MALTQFQNEQVGVVARAAANGRFRTEIQVRGGSFLADEPLEVGGDGAGPTPYELLSAALAACTSMTLRLYAVRKGWDLPPFEVAVAHSLRPASGDAPPRDHFERHISFQSAMDDERRQKLLEIADKCPVHRTLMRGFTVSTTLGPPRQNIVGEPASQHQRDVEDACRDD